MAEILHTKIYKFLFGIRWALHKPFTDVILDAMSPL